MAVLLFAFLVVRSCQQEQVRVTEQQAIATAKQQIDFAPESTQIRLLRQGIDRQPFWIVSLSIPRRGGGEDEYSRLALVHIDANTGKVTEVEEQERGAGGRKEKR